MGKKVPYPKDYSLVPFKKLSVFEEKALIDIEKIKKKKEEREEKAKIEQNRKKIEEMRKQKLFKKEINIRRVESNREPITVDVNEIIQLKDGEYEKNPGKVRGVPDVQLWDIDDLEIPDVDEIKIWMEDNKKLLRYLFSNYSSYELSKRKLGNVPSHIHNVNKVETISVAEIGKMFSEHNISLKLITRAEISIFVKLINQKMKQKLESSVNFECFIELFVQIALYIPKKAPMTLLHLTPIEQVNWLLNEFKKSAKARGERTQLYDNPHATNLADTEVLNRLTAMVASDPEFLLPDGYKAKEEKRIIKKFNVMNFVEIPEKLRICTEIVDDLLKETIGSHVIEPKSDYYVTTRVIAIPTVPQIFKSSSNDNLYIDNRRKSSHFLKPFEEKNTKLTPAMKLEIVCAPNEDKELVKEVAGVLAEVIESVEKGRNHIKPEIPTQKYVEQKISELEAEQKEINRIIELRRKKRAAAQKQKVEEMKRIKEIKEFKKQQKEYYNIYSLSEN